MAPKRHRRQMIGNGERGLTERLVKIVEGGYIFIDRSFRLRSVCCPKNEIQAAETCPLGGISLEMNGEGGHHAAAPASGAVSAS